MALRIVNAMAGGRSRTTADLCARLPDVPRTTVYRHVGLLAGAGVLEVAAERRVQGAVEREYRLRGERAAVDDDAAAAMTLDDHRRGFTAAMAALHAEFNAYLDRDGADPPSDGVGYRQGTVWFTPDELRELATAWQEQLRAHAGPGPGRAPYLLSAIFFPAEG